MTVKQVSGPLSNARAILHYTLRALALRWPLRTLNMATAANICMKHNKHFSGHPVLNTAKYKRPFVNLSEKVQAGKFALVTCSRLSIAMA